MNHTERISVIVPVYNCEKYIGKCIKSIQKQTYSNWKLILVDDGSTDGSSEICDKFAAADSRISVVHQENKGLIGARKTGLANATSEFIAFVDADDLAEPEMLQKLLDTQVQYSADIVCCGFQTLSQRGWIKSKHSRNPGNVRITSGTEEAIRIASSLGFGTMCGRLYRRTLFVQAQEILNTLPRVFIGEDSMINAAVFSKAEKVVLIEEDLYDYRVGGGTSYSTEKTMHELEELYLWRKNYLLNAAADIKYHKANLAQVLNNAVWYAHYSKKVLSREKICNDMAAVIADIADICPNYQHRKAYDLNIPMTDKEFRDIYHESPLIVIKQIILKFT